MKLTTLAFGGSFVLLLALVHVQHYPQWKLDAAVEAAIAAGDLDRAREIAATAKHWARIVEVQYEEAEANQSREVSDRFTLSRQDEERESGEM